MISKFLSVLMLATFSLGLQAADFSQDVKKDDLVPWPWGTECPFPWAKIEGQWTTLRKDHPERFQFDLKGVWKNGTRVIEVRRYNQEDELIGLGEGITTRGEKIVRAAMVGVGPDEGKTYLAFIRTYVEAPKRTCSRGKLVTVVTLRSSDGSEEHDTHVIIEKDSSGNSSKP